MELAIDKWHNISEVIIMTDIQQRKMNILEAIFDVLSLVQDVPNVQSIQELGLLGSKLIDEIKEEQS